ncbi:MAG TPA: nucleotidyltransferase family protein [Gammaproteobacteria bacterium]|nr:nucleotidyltransferase family protein [Gammaproteobacteria bacterium]
MKRVAAIVAAAGYGRRYGAERKLAAILAGRPVLAWTLDALRELPLAQRVLVVAPGDETAAALARSAEASLAVNRDPAQGLGASIACGVRALSPDVDGVLIVLGDMPRVRPASIAVLLERLETLCDGAVVAPLHRGRRGHPVLFGAAHLPALAALTGDEGARAVLAGAQLTSVDVDDPGVLLDIDTPADLAAASGGDRQGGS